MKTYICTNAVCESPCEIHVEDSDFEPTRCPFDVKMDKYLNWIEKEEINDEKGKDINVTTKLPDWCKVGAWVWGARCKEDERYQRVKEIKTLKNGHLLVYLEHDQISGKEFQNNIQKARVRPWMFEEAEELLKGVEHE